MHGLLALLSEPRNSLSSLMVGWHIDDTGLCKTPITMCSCLAGAHSAQGSNAVGACMIERVLATQTQEAEFSAARVKLAHASAKALQREKDLQEACRQLAVLAEDDQDLRDKVCSIWHIPSPAGLLCRDLQSGICGILHTLACHAVFTARAARWK